MLQLKNIRKNYFVGEQVIEALKGISIDFRKNEFVAVLGPSGCGKTTLMNIIGGLDQYTSGDLVINGKSTKDFKDGDWDNYRNKRVGFVFQSYNLIPHQTVIGNVELALTLSGISREERHAKAKEALEQVGLSDQLYKKPNQLSGGQMQRVAIARAIVNSPEILLMDEPTGALDTQTSKQIMELIQKVSQDKLVIMVTHNPELATTYANRLITMLDGVVLEDSNPYDSSKDVAFINDVKQRKAMERDAKKAKKSKDRTSMSFKTALSLSLQNLFTKKGRTILTSIAGSIGIIGVALILAVSSGMNSYIGKIQTDSLASYPITISSSAIDLNQAMNATADSKVWKEFPDKKEVYVRKMLLSQDIMKKNNITQEYIDYVNAMNSTWTNDIIFKTGLEFNLFGQRIGQTDYSKITDTEQTSNSFMGGSPLTWQMILNKDLIDSQYTYLEGDYPTEANQILLVVDKTNRVSEEILASLGLIEVGSDVEKIDFSDILNKKFVYVPNDELYTFSTNRFIEKSAAEINFSKGYTLEIAGIIRANEATDTPVLSTGIAYSKAFYNYVQNANVNSEIVEWMKTNELKNPMTGTEYISNPASTKEEQFEKQLRRLGGVVLPNEINIYPVDYRAKENVRTYLDSFNTGKEKEDQIMYTDLSDMLGIMLGSMVDVVTIVLIAFTSISLVVSSIMIAIITYVSVLERTKEIGILRSIGARKKDITRVFNAETFLIGLLSGIIGVGVTYLLSVPINVIVYNLTEVNNIASLSPLSAVVLILISIGLTVLAGLIPSRGASKKDPVLALRTE